MEFCVGRVLSQERNLALLLEYAKAHPKHTNILVTLPRGEFYAPFETAIPYDSFVWMCALIVHVRECTKA